MSDDDEDDDDEGDSGATFQVNLGKDPSTRQTMRQGGTLLFTRKHDDAGSAARLQDFMIMKMIGKGAFGKVYLVKQRVTNSIFAMKCIRKDVVIDQDFFESLKLEKDILYGVEHPFIVSMDYVF